MTKPQLMPWNGGPVEFKAAFSPLVCPIDESVASQMIESDATVVDAAVEHAHRAFLAHAEATTARRVEWLRAAADAVDAIEDELVSDSLVFRYHPEASPDGLDGDEGTFTICSFWYVEALAAAGRVREARLVFEKILTYANHLGLYSEEIGQSGELLGNFPQAFTHLALVRAAIALDERLANSAATPLAELALA